MDTQPFFDKFSEGIGMFLDMTNPAFLVAFMVVVWVVGMAKIQSRVKHAWFKAIPKAYGVVIQGIILAVIWSVLFDFNTKDQFAELFVSILAGMVTWKMGLSKIGARIQDKVVK